MNLRKLLKINNMFNINKDKKAELLEAIKSRPWRDVLEREVKPKKPFWHERLVYERAADWKVLLPLNHDSTVLDLGCGWGTLTFQLAESAGQVFALDHSSYGTEFIRLRSEQDKISNIIPLRGNALKLPFADRSFDLVVLNGVLEWAGLADSSKDPLLVQKDLLKEVLRVLKPQGSLYLAIENRYSGTYFLGQPEGHVNLRFISLMPRALAKIYHRLVKRSQFRAYTHSLKNYLKILKSSGFKKITSYTPIPQYQKYSHFIPVDKPILLKYYLDKLFFHSKPMAIFFKKAVSFLHFYKLIKYFTPCYSFIASREDIDPEVSSMLKNNWQAISKGSDVSKEIFYILISAKFKIILLVFPKGCQDPTCVVEIPRDSEKKELKNELETLKYLREINDPLISESVPDIIYSESDAKGMVLVKRAVKGKRLEDLIIKKGRLNWMKYAKKYLSLSLNWIKEFQLLTKEDGLILDDNLIDEYLSPIFGALEKQPPQRRDALAKNIEALKNSLKGEYLPLVSQHRDFAPCNIFLDGDSVSVIDWEWCQRKREPLYDVYYLISRYFTLACYNFKVDPYITYETVSKFTEFIYFQGKGYIFDMVSNFVDLHCQALGIDTETAKMLFLWQEIDKNKNYMVLDLFFEKEDKFIL